MIGLTNSDIDRLRAVVAQRVGLVFDHCHLDDLAEVLRQRIRETGSGTAATYFDRLDSAAFQTDEMRNLADVLTVGETYFFRHPAQFQAFVEVALSQRLAERKPQPIRILSAGCASGEEAYSLAVLVHEALAGGAHQEVRITGIDVSAALLAKAARARYSEWSLRATTPEQRQRYFHLEGRDFALCETIRTMVTFQSHNLLEDGPDFWRPEAFDIIFFRNVSIYFAPETTKVIVARMARALAPGGFLFLGPSETLRGISSDFHLRLTHEAFYYQRCRPGEGPQRTPLPASESQVLPGKLLPRCENQPDNSWLEAIRQASEHIAAVSGRTAKQERPSLACDTAPHARDATAAPLPPGLASAAGAPAWDLRPAQELVRQERFEDALAALQALPVESVADPDALLLRAAVLTNQGCVAEAEAVCREVLKVEELNAGAHYLLALCREHAGERHAAVEHDQMAIYLDPAFAMPHFHLGMMTRRYGDLSTAVQELRLALKLLEREESAHILLFGGGFSREALVQLCRAELQTSGGQP
jgi:chemotaxis protein methyltransferase CheR